jgi:UV DNA damage endonuclease
MFPFASHEEYGYKLAPFASEALAEAGKVIAELGHRVTTHPGQFTQLGSPRKPVIDNSIRDLEYHDEMLSLLKLPEQFNKDAVMILHMGGIFEGKKETLDRFRENYAMLAQSVKNRLVLENDDMGWSVHDLLPICEELNIPFVLDFHHHNIVFDSYQIREGTKDIIELFPRIKATWDRKGIRQKMHYSEPTSAAITPRQRRKHSPRVATLPPCPPDMDLMIEAKDKEQAVFELMRTFKLPGYDTFNDVLPHVRSDDNKAAVMELNKRARKSKKKNAEAGEEPEISMVLDDDVGMGGPEGRVYWPPGMEEWLRQKKREVKKKDLASVTATSTTKETNGTAYVAPEAKPRSNGKVVKASAKKGRAKKAATPPSVLSDESEELGLDDDDEDAPLKPAKPSRALSKPRATSRKARKSVNYNEDDAEMEEA